jgi:hypothetical protein
MSSPLERRDAILEHAGYGCQHREMPVAHSNGSHERASRKVCGGYLMDLSEIAVILLIWLVGMILTIAFYAVIIFIVIYILLWLLQLFGVIALMAMMI